MNKSPVNFQKLFEDSPMPRLVISRTKKDYFYVEKANAAAVKYFCPNEAGDCTTIDGMYLPEFMDSANTTHILQALSVCYESKVPITIQVVPKHTGNLPLQTFMLSPIIGDNGEMLWIDMQSRPPINEQAVIERERDDAISMFTTVFDISDVGITVTDHHGRFVRINDAFIRQTGWQPIDLMGEKLDRIIPERHQDTAWQRHHQALNEEKKNFGEIIILRNDGTEMNVMVTSVMMELSNGRTFRITTVVDITDLKKIERDLRKAKDEADEANMAKSAFLANMSHELRTPLNAIIGFSEMMINGTLGVIENENYIEYLGDIKFSAKHLLQIINDVLDMSKIEAGKMPLDEEDINLVGLLDSVRRLMMTKAEEKNVTITLDSAEIAPHMRGDERLMRQIFLNLVSNAVKFSNDKGNVKIQVLIDNDIRITVIDDGIGIPNERLGEVVEPFGQVTDPRVNKGQGTGLGLPIARAMVEMHGGELVIESEKDKGTSVTCVFPQSRLMV